MFETDDASPQNVEPTRQRSLLRLRDAAQDNVESPLRSRSRLAMRVFGTSDLPRLGNTLRGNELIANDDTEPYVLEVVDGDLPVVTPVTLHPGAYPRTPSVGVGPALPMLKAAAAATAAQGAPRRRGLAVEDIQSPSPHVWLLHQRAGGPVRARVFSGVAEFDAFRQKMGVSLPRYAMPHARTARDKRRATDASSRASSSATPTASRDSRATDTHTGTSTAGNERVLDVYWLDFQSRDEREIQAFLDLFHLSDATVDEVLTERRSDHVEQFPSFGYVFVNITCVAVASAGSFVVGVRKSDSFTGAQEIVVSCLVFRDWIVTIHRHPFEELAALVKQIRMNFALKGTLRARAHHGGHGEAGAADEVASVVFKRMMRPPWVLSTLVDFVVSNFLPNPTPLLRLVDDIQGDVMLLTTNFQLSSQADVAQRIARARRVISYHQNVMNSKVQLLTALTQPQMRGSVVCVRASESDTYAYCAHQLSKVISRFASARDNLYAANANFVSAGQLYGAKNQHVMEQRLSVMAKLNCIVQPLNLVSATFSTNLYLPFYWSSLGPDWQVNVRAFWVMMGLYAIWLLIFTPGLVREYLQLQQHNGATYDKTAFDDTVVI